MDFILNLYYHGVRCTGKAAAFPKVEFMKHLKGGFSLLAALALTFSFLCPDAFALQQAMREGKYNGIYYQTWLSATSDEVYAELQYGVNANLVIDGEAHRIVNGVKRIEPLYISNSAQSAGVAYMVNAMNIQYATASYSINGVRVETMAQFA